jgi:hypothetical protein
MKNLRHLPILLLSFIVFFAAEKYLEGTALKDVLEEASSSSSSSLEKEGNRLKGTQTILKSSPEKEAFYSQPVVFIVQVVPTHLPGTPPTGTVQFEIDHIAVATQSLVNGTAQWITSTLATTPLNQHQIRVIYSGDENYASSSDFLRFSVLPASTTASLKSRPNPSLFGQVVHLIANVEPVAPGKKIPNGSVQIQMDGNPIANVNLDIGGQAAFSSADLSVGLHRMTAIYQGNKNFNASQAELNHQVVKAPSVLHLTSTENPSLFGQTFALVMKVTSPGGIPSGMVQLVIDGKKERQRVFLNQDGEAKAIRENWVSGSHQITAYYLGDEHFEPSSAFLTQQVNKASTKVELTSLPHPSLYGQPVEMIAKVSSENVQPIGLIQFKVDGKKYGSPQLLSQDGQVKIVMHGLKAGSHQIEAAYLGHENFSSSNTTFTQRIDKAETSISVNSSVNPSQLGEPVTFVATVMANEALQGTVQFQIDARKMGTPLSLNEHHQASLTLSSELKEGKQQVVAVYSGDENFQPSVSSPLIQVAILAILPPTEAQGFQFVYSAGKERKLINVLKWQPPQKGEPPVAYRIYRDEALHNLVATVPADHSLEFTDLVRQQEPFYPYFVVSVDALDHESEPVRIEIVSAPEEETSQVHSGV